MAKNTLPYDLHIDQTNLIAVTQGLASQKFQDLYSLNLHPIYNY